MSEFRIVNEKVIAAAMRGEVVYARVGSMIAYTGEVSFARSFLGNGGVSNMAMRAATNEGIALMAAQGNGEVHYADHGRHVFVVDLQGQELQVESGNVLAFDGQVRAGTAFLGNRGVGGIVSGMAAGQGLFTSTFAGRGQVAITSHGDLIALPVTQERPLFVDPQAYIGHLGNLSSSIHTDVNWKTLIGQRSGESYQLKFVGQGTVYIQASEV